MLLSRVVIKFVEAGGYDHHSEKISTCTKLPKENLWTSVATS
jgi:hypothetical protein